MILGDQGHIAVIVSLIAALLSSYSYWMSMYSHDLISARQWKKIARVSFQCHAWGVMSIVLSLFLIIFLEKYAYHYAWSHSSSSLPFYYMISCFWEGQEGSFILWVSWNVIVGLILMKVSNQWEISVMALFTLIQLFLVSMVLGIYFPALDLKIGSSPFLLLNQALDAPVFKENPEFVPLDGNGLNPLLQNYWMVIHPPVIFLGFSLSAVPFCYAVAGLLKADFSGWIKQAFPWLSATVLVMATGIMMGAYWAYETLNFGGYWSWDPVENAIYIPWLVLVAALHGALLVSKKKPAEKHTTILVIAGFILVLYATFLTRSGILGNSSVHSFTDLGLSGQLLLYLLFFLLIAVALLAWRWKEIQKDADAKSLMSYDFWVFLGTIILCLAAFQVLIPTSIPVYNSILSALGIRSNLAPPSSPILFYTKFQCWFAVAFGLMAGISQLIYASKSQHKKQLEERFIWTIVATLVTSALIIFVSKMVEFNYIMVLTACVFGFFSSISILESYQITQIKNWGGALSHIGMFIMIIGMVFSAGYSKVISSNQSLEFATGTLDEPVIRENILVEHDRPSEIRDYTVHFRGSYYEDNDGNKLPKSTLLNTNIPAIKIVKRDLISDFGVTFSKGDTIAINVENQYYDLIFAHRGGAVFHVTPRIQNNPKMGLIASPSIKKFLDKDIYLHVTNYADEEKKIWTAFKDFTVSLGDSIYVDDYVLSIAKAIKEDGNPMVPKALAEKCMALTADITISNGFSTEVINPLFIVAPDRSVKLVPDKSEGFGTKVLLKKIDLENQQAILSISRTQPDWVTLKIIEMPMINLLWLGTIILIIGVSLSVKKRIIEVAANKKLINEKVPSGLKGNKPIMKVA